MELAMAILATTLLMKALETQGLLVPPPGCNRSCGDVQVPFPFGVGGEGVGKGCFFPRPGFRLTCNYSEHPPKLFLGKEGEQIQVVSLKLSSAELVALFPLSYLCYDDSPKSTAAGLPLDPEIGGFGSPSPPASGLQTVASKDSMTWNLTLDDAYRLSTANVYTAVGCGTWALMDIGGGNYGGCISGCGRNDSAVDGQCSGVGCCQASIPTGIGNYITKFNYTDPAFYRCSFSFLVEKDKYTFRKDDLANLDNSTKFPFVLDWAIRMPSDCEAARTDEVSYACLSIHSECINSKNDPGYVCNCSQGYQGNPYEKDGCQDMDECQLGGELYPCYGLCENTPGSYKCTCPDGQSSEDPKKFKCMRIENARQAKALKVILGASFGFFALVVVCLLGFCLVERRKLQRLRKENFAKNGGNYLKEVLFHNRSKFRIFSMEELEKATNGFDPETVLGAGGFGTVYKGVTEDQQAIAIKKSKVAEENSGNDLANEIYILSTVNHKNIVEMVGCCLEDKIPILVYAYIPNGTLFHFIHKNKQHRFPFSARLRIARETAEALKYLHNDISPPIVHGDMKPHNILLDEWYSVKVSDFGTSKLVPKDKDMYATYLQGTIGYMDPESLLRGAVTDKSDVYSFAVVLLELLTRRPPVYSDAPEGEETSLAADFIKCVDKGRVLDILDPEIVGDGYLSNEVQEVVRIARRCLNPEGRGRPTMKDVLAKLENLSIAEEQPWEPSSSDRTVITLSDGPEYPSTCSIISNAQDSSSIYTRA